MFSFVSVYRERERIVMSDYKWEDRYKATVFCNNASARYRPPSASMELYERSSSVSVYR